MAGNGFGQLVVDMAIIETDGGGIETADGKNAEFSFEDDYPEEYDQRDRMFEFIEDEGKTALVCEADKSPVSL